MSKIEDGGPAFPSLSRWSDATYTYSHEGMSLRDKFAESALVGWLSGIPDGSAMHDDTVARRCYAIADAMLRAREAT